MAAVGEDDFARADVEDAGEQRHEGAALVADGQVVVHASQDFGRIAPLLGGGTQQHHHGRHEHGRRHALARDVADGEEQVRVVEREVVEQVAAGLLCGFHGGLQLHAAAEFRRRERAGQEGFLDLAGDPQLAFGAFAGGLRELQLLDVRGEIRLHLVEVVGEDRGFGLGLVAVGEQPGIEADVGREAALHEAAGEGRQADERLRDGVAGDVAEHDGQQEAGEAHQEEVQEGAALQGFDFIGVDVGADDEAPPGGILVAHDDGPQQAVVRVGRGRDVRLPGLLDLVDVGRRIRVFRPIDRVGGGGGHEVVAVAHLVQRVEVGAADVVQKRVQPPRVGPVFLLRDALRRLDPVEVVRRQQLGHRQRRDQQALVDSALDGFHVLPEPVEGEERGRKERDGEKRDEDLAPDRLPPIPRQRLHGRRSPLRGPKAQKIAAPTPSAAAMAATPSPRLRLAARPNAIGPSASPPDSNTL